MSSAPPSAGPAKSFAPGPAAGPITAHAGWAVIVCAASILLITMGIRQSTGLFVSPLNSATGLGLVEISFALAVGQFMWGAAQAGFGAIADSWGVRPVLIAGGVMLAIGLGLTPLLQSSWGLVFTMGVLTAAGAGAGSLSVMIGAVAQQVAPERRSFAAGFINAGGSFGQFVFAPYVERLIALFGWINAFYALALTSLLTIPFALRLGAGKTVEQTRVQTTAPDSPIESAPSPDGAAEDARAPAVAISSAATAPQITLREQIREAFKDRSYIMLHLGFFTCGFHIAFLVTHLPGEVALCNMPTTVSSTALAIIGLSNVVGSLMAGSLGARMRMKYLLFWMYLSRAILILVYMAAPKEPITFYLFAVGLGLTWLATVPPTAGLVGKLFGIRYMSTLFGLTLLSHQTGGFLGAWLGGIAFTRFGSYDWMWIADAALATAAALVNLPIREQPVVRLKAA